MNENAKKGILIVVVIAALIVAGFGASRLFQGEQPQVVETVQGSPGASEKEQAIQTQQGGNPAASGGERDLSGAMPGAGEGGHVSGAGKGG